MVVIITLNYMIKWENMVHFTTVILVNKWLMKTVHYKAINPSILKTTSYVLSYESLKITVYSTPHLLFWNSHREFSAGHEPLPNILCLWLEEYFSSGIVECSQRDIKSLIRVHLPSRSQVFFTFVLNFHWCIQMALDLVKEK